MTKTYEPYGLASHSFEPTIKILDYVATNRLLVTDSWQGLLDMQGSQLIALLIGILLLIVTIGWLVFCWYRRHVSMGVMASQARARVIRDRRRANYDLERGDQHGDHIPPPKYRSDAWQRPSTRPIPHDPREPDYVILRRTNEDNDHYRTRGFRREYLSPERRHPDSRAESEQQQAHRQDQRHQQQQQSQPQHQQNQGKKQKQKKGNQNNQNNYKNNQSGQNNQVEGSKQGNKNNQGSQANNPSKGKKKKKGKNKDNNGETPQQSQEDQQDNDSWVNTNLGQDQQEDDYGQQDSQNNHQSLGSQRNGSNRDDNGWTLPQNSNQSSNRGSQGGSNGHQQNTTDLDAGW